MIAPEYVSMDNLGFQRGNISKLRMYNSQEVFGMGQSGPIEDYLNRLKEWAKEKALYLVAIGGVVGAIGSILLKGGPFEMTVTTAGGVILAMGLLPLIMGVLA